MYTKFATLGIAAAIIAGCGSEPAPSATPVPSAPATATAPAPAPTPASTPASTIPMRNFAALKIGAYDVQPMFEEEIEDGHFNIKVSGGEVKAVRMWVGPEDASGVMVVKTEIENDYNHGHVEVPKPVPADATLWIELETPTGELLKGSVPLKQAS